MPASAPTPPEPDRNAAKSDHRVPSQLVRALTGALFAEAALAAVAAAVFVVDLVRAATGSQGDAGPLIGMNVFLALSAAGLAAALVAAGRALARGRRSGRSVAMTWQLFQAVVGVTAIVSGGLGPALLGVVLLALAVAVVVLLLTPRVVEETTQR